MIIAQAQCVNISMAFWAPRAVCGEKQTDPWGNACAGELQSRTQLSLFLRETLYVDKKLLSFNFAGDLRCDVRDAELVYECGRQTMVHLSFAGFPFD